MKKLKHLNAGRKRKRNVTSYVTVTPKFDMPEGFQHNDDEEDENDNCNEDNDYNGECMFITEKTYRALCFHPTIIAGNKGILK